MEEKYKISVIVPIYNTEKYIQKCVCSLMEQTLDGIEYIFVNDATPDNSIKILQDVICKYPLRKDDCIILHHNENRGLATARNTGLEKAKGKYIYHCDSDDFLETYMLEKLYNVATDKDLDVVYCDFYMDYSDRVVPYNAVDYDENKIEFLKNYITYGWNVVWNTLVRRDIYKANS